MSCNCNHNGDAHPFPCPCDSFIHPVKLNIGMGLTDIPRQIAGFPEFRKAMLFSLRPKLIIPSNPADPVIEDPADFHKHSLGLWNARRQEDLGVMLLEMWAYICDSLSFYDKVIAQEEYLRTALRRPSLRKLTGLLGYLPRPATGSSVYLTALADGRLAVKLPKGTSFRSSGFDGNPPQTFELEDDAFVHPLTNKWTIKAPNPGLTKNANPIEFLADLNAAVKPGTPLLILDKVNSSFSQAAWINSIEQFTGNDRKKYSRLGFNKATSFNAQYPLKNLDLYLPAGSVGLWTIQNALNGPSIPANGRSIVLDGQQRQIKSGQYIIICNSKECRWFLVKEITEETMHQGVGDVIKINGIIYDIPGISVPVTCVHLDVPINDNSRKQGDPNNWTDANKAGLTVYYGLALAGQFTDEPKTVLSPNDPLDFVEKLEKPFDEFKPAKFMLTDKNIRGAKIGGQLNYDTSALEKNINDTWQPDLTLPVEAFGNVIKVSRGETVEREILGSGDTTIPNQTFKLKKKPLTYFAAPTVANDTGVKNTLSVYVDGIRWTEVPAFFNRKPGDEIYIVRQNDAGDSYVTFGDGIRGRRLPTGIDNIIGKYRFGAERPAPPATTVNQIGKPVLGLSSVNNPLEASGGDDAEAPEGLRTCAPKSILTLGRIVSIQDVEAVTLAAPGVRAAQVEWHWHGVQQCPVVQVWYVGAAGIEEDLTKRLRSLADPSLFINVDRANAVLSVLTIDIGINPAHIAKDVKRNVRDAFMDQKNGLLSPENIGIGKPLFRSRIFSTALNVAGVISIRNISWNGEAFTHFAKTPGTGNYFDFEKGQLIISNSH